MKEASQARQSAFEHLIIKACENSIDSYMQTLAYISIEESTMIKKILAFDTNDVTDYEFCNFQFKLINFTQ